MMAHSLRLKTDMLVHVCLSLIPYRKGSVFRRLNNQYVRVSFRSIKMFLQLVGVSFFDT